MSTAALDWFEKWLKQDPSWVFTDETYQQRIDHLRGTTTGGTNGSFFLKSTTVKDDAKVDSLTGGLGMDWFWANLPQDTITDLQVGELIN